jgi:hypothetical protein
MLAAIVVALAATAVGWFGLNLDSDEPAAERSVRRIPVVTPAVVVVPRDTDTHPLPC